MSYTINIKNIMTPQNMTLFGLFISSFMIFSGYLQYIIIHWLFPVYLLIKSIAFVNATKRTNVEYTKLFIKKWIMYTSYVLSEKFIDYLVIPFGWLYYVVKLFLINWLLFNDHNYIIAYEFSINLIYINNKAEIDNLLTKIENYHTIYKQNIYQIYKNCLDNIREKIYEVGSITGSDKIYLLEK